MNEQTIPQYWFTQIEIEKIINDLINKLAINNNIFNINYETYVKKYGYIHFKSYNNNLLINFKNSKTPNLIKTNKINNCCVCYEDCNRTLKCGHYLCSKCSKWIKTSNTCPMCRKGNNYKIGYILKIPFKALKVLIL